MLENWKFIRRTEQFRSRRPSRAVLFSARFEVFGVFAFADASEDSADPSMRFMFVNEVLITKHHWPKKNLFFGIQRL